MKDFKTRQQEAHETLYKLETEIISIITEKMSILKKVTFPVPSRPRDHVYVTSGEEVKAMWIEDGHVIIKMTQEYESDGYEEMDLNGDDTSASLNTKDLLQILEEIVDL